MFNFQLKQGTRNIRDRLEKAGFKKSQVWAVGTVMLLDLHIVSYNYLNQLIGA